MLPIGSFYLKSWQLWKLPIGSFFTFFKILAGHKNREIIQSQSKSEPVDCRRNIAGQLFLWIHASYPRLSTFGNRTSWLLPHEWRFWSSIISNVSRIGLDQLIVHVTTVVLLYPSSSCLHCLVSLLRLTREYFLSALRSLFLWRNLDPSQSITWFWSAAWSVICWLKIFSGRYLFIKTLGNTYS